MDSVIKNRIACLKWRQKNREKERLRGLEHAKSHREERKKYSNQYYHENKDIILERQKESKYLQKAKSYTREYSLLLSAKRRAKNKNLPFDLVFEDIVFPAYCPVLGIEIKPEQAMSNHNASIDRIDNSKGYTKDNIRIISWKANRIKSNSTIKELELILNYMKTM